MPPRSIRTASPVLANSQPVVTNQLVQVVKTTTMDTIQGKVSDSVAKADSMKKAATKTKTGTKTKKK